VGAVINSADELVVDEIRDLARHASIEINVGDLEDLPSSRAFLPPGSKVYVSCLPKQTWEDTQRAARRLRETGFEAVPHIPVRLLSDAQTLSRLLETLVETARVREMLLISGDYPRAVGPYSCVADVLRSGLLRQHGLRGVSIAGHPEGHPRVALADIRQAETQKVVIANREGLELTFVTQFFFEATPFLDWVDELRRHGVRARLVGGLCGPARVTSLLKYAVRCGVGASIRALSARGASVMKLMAEHGPEPVMRALAEARCAGESNFTGVHLFCFGGYLRTCEWLHRVAAGQFTLNDSGGFDVYG
jgi:methylenetetrahydrofolate reductase (NADPH)